MQMTLSSVSVSMAAFSPSSILLVGLPMPSLATPSFLMGGDLALQPAARFPCHPISTASPDMTDAAGQ